MKKKITYDDRKQIETMIDHGEKVVKIAETIGVHRATIYNELKRCEPYNAEIAQRTL